MGFLRSSSLTGLEWSGAPYTAAVEEKMKLRINGGAKIKSISPGKLKAAGIQPGFIITKVDEEMVETPEDLKRVLGSKSKGEGIMIEGVYPNGTRAYYGFGL